MNKIYLTEAYAIDSNSILRILTQNKQINKSDPNYSHYEKLAKWANENGRQQKLKNIDLSAIKLSDSGLIEKRKLTTRYTTLGHLLNALKNLMDQEGKYTPGSEISKLVQQTTLDILTQLSTTRSEVAPTEEHEEPTKKSATDDETKANESELYAGMDWTAEKARRLEAAKGTPSEILDKFYNDYYSVEYAGGTSNAASIATKLKSLDKILIPEFNALGYNPDVNPFAQFLKLLIKYKPEIFNRLTTNTYGAVHNAFIAKSITGNMLGNYNAGNILFCADLYNRNGLDIVEYLLLQSQAIAATNSNNKYVGDKDLIAKMFIQQRSLDSNYAENIRKLFEEPGTTKFIQPGDSGAKLRSELEVRELYRYLFKAVPKKAITPKVAEEILGRVRKADAVLSMIRYILDQHEFTGSTKYAKFAQDTREWLENTMKYHRNTDKIYECEKILDDYVLNAPAENLIVRHLRDYAEAVRAKENKKEADQ